MAANLQVMAAQAAIGGYAGQAKSSVQKMFAKPDEEVDDVMEAAGGAELEAAQNARQERYELRICVHHAENMPREKMFAALVLDGVRVDQSPTAPESICPTWEHVISVPVSLGAKNPTCDLEVYADRLALVGDKLLGTTKLDLPSQATEGPKRSTLTLSGMQSSFPGWEAPKSKLLIAWQVCEVDSQGRAVGALDLTRVVEMDEQASEAQIYTFDVNILGLHLRAPTQLKREVAVQVSVRPLDKERKIFCESTPTTKVELSGLQIAAQKKSDKKAAPQGTYAHWHHVDKHKGWNKSWEMRSSEIGLLGYELCVTATFKAEEGKVEKHIGTWMESAADLKEDIDADARKLNFYAELLHEKDDLRTGYLHMQVDIYKGSERNRDILKPKTSYHMVDDKSISKEGTRVRGNRGQAIVSVRPSKHHDEAHTITYYVSLFADNLPSATTGCDPYVKIIMGQGQEGRKKSATVRDKIYNVQWDEPVSIRTSSTDQKARIELWNDVSFLGGDNGDELIGEETIYDINTDRTSWVHFFGGAPGAPKADEAIRMTRGPAKNASTYRGSVALHFGTKPRVPRNFFKECKAAHMKACLSVRLYRGLYFEKWADRRVHVVVQVPGCSLPVYPGYKRGSDAQTGFGRNRSLLEFPAKIDRNGVLRFLIDDSEKQYAIEEDGGQMASYGRDAGKELLWVERRTPRDVQLKWPTGVHHAYLYVVADDEEDLPPQVFGRIRLTENVEEECPPPVWKRMRYDTSVVDLREGDMKDNLAGFILGSAVMKPFAEDVQVGIEGLPTGAEAKDLYDRISSFFDSKPMDEQTPTNRVSNNSDPFSNQMDKPKVEKVIIIDDVLDSDDKEPKCRAIVYLRPHADAKQLTALNKSPSQGGEYFEFTGPDAKLSEPKLYPIKFHLLEPLAAIDFARPRGSEDQAGWREMLGNLCADVDDEDGGRGQDDDEDQPSPEAGFSFLCGADYDELDELKVKRPKNVDPAKFYAPPDEGPDLEKARPHTEVLVRPTRPASNLCRPCAGEQLLHTGSPGEMVRYCFEGEKEDYFCHVDMLAARSLVAADDDGLATPCYVIKCEDKSGGNTVYKTQSLNPTYNERLTIGPVQLPEMPGASKFELPRPPVVVQMLDQDVFMGGKTTWDSLGTAVAKRPSCLPYETKPGGKPFPTPDGRLDLNRNHTPFWYALDAKGSVKFDPMLPNGTELSWRRRPRVLMCVGYSVLPNNHTASDEQQKGREKIKAKQDAHFEIKIDLLGLRNMPPELNFPKLLKIPNFWDMRAPAAAKLAIGKKKKKDKALVPQYDFSKGLLSFGGAKTNLSCTATTDDSIFPEYEKRLRPFFNFKDTEDSSPKAASEPGASARRSPSKSSSAGGLGMGGAARSTTGISGAPSRMMPDDVGAVAGQLQPTSMTESEAKRRFGGLQKELEDHRIQVTREDVLGYRIVPPTYTVPVIPYLQPKFQPPEENPQDRPSMMSLHEGVGSSVFNDFVLMPDLVIELQDKFTSNNHGTLSEPLPLTGFFSLGPESAQIVRRAERLGRCKMEYTPKDSPSAQRANAPKKLALKVNEHVEVKERDPRPNGGWLYGCKVIKTSCGIALVGGEQEEGWFPEWAVDVEDGATWAEKSAYEYKQVIERWNPGKDPEKDPNLLEPSDITRIQARDLVPMEEAYDIFVDVFASKDGYLKWDPSFMLGRKLRSQTLLTIADDEWAVPHRHDPGSDNKDKKDEDGALEWDDAPEWACCCSFKACSCVMLVTGLVICLLGHGIHNFSYKMLDNGGYEQLPTGTQNFLTSIGYDHEVAQPNERKELTVAAGIWIAWVVLGTLIYCCVLQCCKCRYMTKESLEDALDRSEERKRQAADAVVEQRFNSADYLCGRQEYEHVPFDESVMPSLRCAKLTQPKDTVQQWESTRVANKAPLSRGDLFWYFKHDKLQRTLLQQSQSSKNSRAWKKLALPENDDEALKKLKTKDLETYAASGGWRSVSHLHAPEPLPSATNRLRFGGKPILDGNLHTFVRDVGHTVDMGNRNSRYLARLRMGLPGELISTKENDLRELEEKEQQDPDEIKKLQDEISKLKKQEAEQCNFLCVKFHKPGVVTWVSPEAKSLWNKPGELLFLVRLEDGGGEVPILVPNFDLRFPFETCWTPVKSLVAASKDLAKKLHDLAEAKEKGGTAAAVSTAKVGAGGKLEYVPDGHSRPIEVTKHAFLCRIQKENVSVAFDRPQTKNWWRTVLEPTFPELCDLPAPETESDTEMVRRFFLSRFLNLSQPLTRGQEHESVGVVKGHVRVKQIDGKKEGEDEHEATVDIRPIENLWIEAPVNLSICVLTARNLNLEGFGEHRLFVRAQIVGGKEIRDSRDQPQTASRTQNQVNFYYPIQLYTRIPKGTMLRLEVWSEGGLLNLGQDQLVGYCEVDLEDRWMAMQQMKLRENSSWEYIRNSTAPWHERDQYDKERKNKNIPNRVFFKSLDQDPDAERVWKDAEEPISKFRKIVEWQEDKGDDDFKEEIEPRLKPAAPLPIETRELKKKDDETEDENMVGHLRFWVDLMPEGETGIESKIESSDRTFELRIKVEDINGVNVFTDFGERNDIKIKGILEHKTPLSPRPEFEPKVTDTHKFARSSANFQWMWVFKVTAPATMIQLHLYVKNENSVTSDEQLYDREVVALDNLLMLAYNREVDGREAYPKYEHMVTFDAPSASVARSLEKARRSMPFARVRHWGYKPPPVKVDPATLRLTIEIVPEREARLNPVQEGRPGGDNIAGRVQWPQILMQPGEAAEVFFGNRNLWLARTALMYAGAVVILFFTLAVLYLLGAVLGPVIQGSMNQ